MRNIVRELIWTISDPSLAMFIENKQQIYRVFKSQKHSNTNFEFGDPVCCAAFPWNERSSKVEPSVVGWSSLDRNCTVRMRKGGFGVGKGRILPCQSFAVQAGGQIENGTYPWCLYKIWKLKMQTHTHLTLCLLQIHINQENLYHITKKQFSLHSR